MKRLLVQQLFNALAAAYPQYRVAISMCVAALLVLIDDGDSTASSAAEKSTSFPSIFETKGGIFSKE